MSNFFFFSMPLFLLSHSPYNVQNNKHYSENYYYFKIIYNYLQCFDQLYTVEMCYSLILRYEKRSNCPYKLSASLLHLSSTCFLHTLNLVRVNLNIFLVNLFFKKANMNLILFVDLKKELALAWHLIQEILQNIFIIISNYSTLSFSCLKNTKKEKIKKTTNPAFTKWFYFTTFSITLCLFFMPEQHRIIVVLWYRGSFYPSVPVKFLGNFIHNAHLTKPQFYHYWCMYQSINKFFPSELMKLLKCVSFVAKNYDEIICLERCKLEPLTISLCMNSDLLVELANKC